MGYVDGYLLPLLEGNVERYKETARAMGEMFREHGALSVVECLADDVPYGELTSFPRAVQCEEGETVVFAWITYASREQRDAVNAKVMNDPRMKAMMDDMLIDGKRMIFGGFRPIVSLP